MTVRTRPKRYAAKSVRAIETTRLALRHKFAAMAMNVLVMGGAQLSGPFLVRDLLRAGHRVTLFHRGNHPRNVPVGVGEILAPREADERADRFTCARSRASSAVCGRTWWVT
jgi:hypothetical protein